MDPSVFFGIDPGILLQMRRQLFIEQCNIRERYEELTKRHTSVVKVGRRCVIGMTRADERARRLRLDASTHRRLVIAPLSNVVLNLKAQVQEGGSDGVHMVAHMELYHLECEVMSMLRMEQRRKRALALQDRLLDKFDRVAEVAEDLKIQLNQQSQALDRSYHTMRSICIVLEETVELYQPPEPKEGDEERWDRVFELPASCWGDYEEGSEQGELRPVDRGAQDQGTGDAEGISDVAVAGSGGVSEGDDSDDVAVHSGDDKDAAD